MKPTLRLTVILSLCFSSKTFAQSITLTPNTQSMIDANSTTQGVLFPRMNSLQRINIGSPANGLLVYDTNTNGFWYSQNGFWTELPKSSLWSINGIAGNEIRNTNAGGFWSSNPTILPFIDDNGLSQTAPTSGAGTRLMWISSRSAFRCGTVNGDGWDAANVGLHSFASGYNSRAIGLGCIALGTNAISDGTSNTIAFGENTRAIGNNGLAMGYGARVNAQYGVAIGNNSIADGTSNTIAIGEVANASGTNGVAIGTGCYANSYYSVAMGYNNLIPIANATSWVASDPLFTIGNGQNSAARSNAFLMLKNGKTAIGNTTPQSFLHVFEGESGTSPNSNSMATFEKNGIGYISILTPEANENGISFGLPSSNVSGGIYYNSAGSKGLQFRTGGNSTKMSILANGNVGIGVSPSAKLEVNGDVILGTNGTAINEIIKVTINTDLASIAAVSSISKTFTVPNAAVGSTVYISPNAELPDGIVIANARVSALNTVIVKFTNATTAAINPATMDYHITVIR